MGDAFITETMAAHGAVFGGEPVGAWVFPEVHMCPDGVLSALKLIEALRERDMTLEEFVESAPGYPLGRAKLPCPDPLKQKAMEVVSESYMGFLRDVQKESKVDGLRLELETGWVLIRPSGTEPLIRLTVEGRTGEE